MTLRHHPTEATRTPRQRPVARRRRVLAALLAVAVVALAPPPRAEAARYVVLRCVDPLTLGAPGKLARLAHGWVAEGPGAQHGNACTPVTTRGNGRFTASTRLGPSRVLRFSSRRFSTSRRVVRGPLLRLRVRRAIE